MTRKNSSYNRISISIWLKLCPRKIARVMPQHSRRSTPSTPTIMRIEASLIQIRCLLTSNRRSFSATMAATVCHRGIKMPFKTDSLSETNPTKSWATMTLRWLQEAKSRPILETYLQLWSITRMLLLDVIATMLLSRIINKRYKPLSMERREASL